MNYFYNKSFFLFFTLFCFGFMAFGQEAFISVWKSNSYGTSSNNQIFVPLQGEYQYSWFEVADPDNSGEGTDTDEILITFPSSGIYEVSFVPTGENPLHQIQFNGNHKNLENDAYKLRQVKQWGDIEWSSFEKAFNGTEYLSITATDIPNLSNVTNMSQAFRYSGIVQVPNMNDWDVSNVTNMSSMFLSAEEFNTDITNWDVSNVKNMSGMFGEATSFNQPIGVWDVSSVTNMGSMFYNYDPFGMYFQKTMETEDEGSFNQSLNDWDVSNVTNMSGMFNGAFAFNQPIDQWDVSKVTNMAGMFAKSPFNQDISAWDVTSVESMGSMFSYTYSFNQDISNWDVSNVSNFEFMFGEASAFNQSLAGWTFKDNASGMAMFWETGLSCENLSLSLRGWAANPEMGSHFSLDATMRYSPEVSDDIDYLINTLNWSIGANEGTCTLSLPKNMLSDLKIYPNPTSDFVQFSGITEIDQVEIFDIQGKIILQVNEVLENEKVDLTQLSSGIYWMALSIDHQKIVRKLVVQQD